MVEHDDKIFEHDIDEMLRRLDSEIKIPDIPDAQNIFEKAEEKKTKVLPFRKITKYVAAAAAVVLVMIAAPVIGEAVSGRLASEAEPEAKDIGEYVYSSDDAVPEEAVEPETQEEPEESEMPETVSSTVETETQTADEALREFFSSLSINSQKEGSGAVHNEKFEIDEVKYITEELDEDRSIEVAIDREFVSVTLKEVVDDEETVYSFWVEGIYEGSYLEGKYYFINMKKEVDEESLEDKSYLPMVGDEENGIYTIPEESIFVSETVEEGIISLLIEFNVETGEYKIYASLV